MSATIHNMDLREISYDLPPGVPARYFSGGTPIFTAYGCALVERQTAKSFVYSAVNLTNGKSEILCRRMRPLEKSDHAKLAAKIRELSIAGTGRLNIDQPPCETLSHQQLSKILNVIFADVLPQYGYAVRETQIGLAEHILEALSRRAISLAESEVGTGKTLAYLIASVLAKRGRMNDFWLRGHEPQQSYAASAYMPAVIATSSIALQRAVAQDYIPQLSDILMAHGVIHTPLICAVRKGREHFLCEKRLRSFYQDADAKTKSTLQPLMAFDASCDLAETEGLTPYIKRKICVSGKCGGNCHDATSCRYFRYMRQANDSKLDSLITNHNYFLADVLHRASGKRPLLPHYQMVIIDEAHKFLGAARQMYGLSLEGAEFTKIAVSIHTFTEGKSQGGVNIHRLAKKLEEQGKRLFRRLSENAPDTEDDDTQRLPASMDAEVSRHLRSIAGIASDLIAALDDSHVQTRFRERKSQTIWELTNLKTCAVALKEHAELVCWMERQEEDGDLAISAIPQNLGARLHQDIWSKGIPVVLTSGTLSAGGDFSRIAESLGLTHLRDSLVMKTSQPSPFDYRENTMLYMSDKVPFPNQQDSGYLLSVADEIQRLVVASYGHAAVLFTSYSSMGQVFAMLRERNLPFPMFQMGRRDTAALEKFKASGNGILFASGSFWEGIDIPGDALSLLVIVKLPFAVPDPIGEYEKTLYPDIDTYKTQALVPDMLVKLKQGFGRLIRTETDTGVVALLDSRARCGAPYHDRVISALPDCRVTSDLAAVTGFLREKKSSTYFEEGKR